MYIVAPVLGAQPPMSVQVASEFHGVLATPQGFVVWGAAGSGSVTGSTAAVWTSPDGLSWEGADPAQFTSALPLRKDHAGGPASWISDLTVRDGALIGVGEIYTDSRQPDGGQPCIWRSRDGAHWTHRVVDLGPGFDPNVGSLAVFDGSVFLARTRRPRCRDRLVES